MQHQDRSIRINRRFGIERGMTGMDGKTDWFAVLDNRRARFDSPQQAYNFLHSSKIR